MGVLQPSQSCYGFCIGQGNDPSLLKASVQSSGVKDVAGYANTYRGFSLAMLHLQDVGLKKIYMEARMPMAYKPEHTSLTVTPRGRPRKAGR